MIGALVFLNGRKNSSENVEVAALNEGQYEYFWGDGCPHCAKVAEFMDGWEQPESVEINKLETWYDSGNAKIMQARASSCGLPNNQVGVPLLYTYDGQCIVGDTPIIDYLGALE